MIKIKLIENKILNEITMEDVEKTFFSKASIKKFAEIYGHGNLGDFRFKELISEMIREIKRAIPDDIQESEKGLTFVWLKNQILSSNEMYTGLIKFEEFDGITTNYIRVFLERFFQWKNFIQRDMRDLNRVPNIETLRNIVNDAKESYMAHQQQKANKDASLGTEVIYEDDNYKIFIPNNKGAACQLGKGTEWCTAAPGLEYYEQYHKPEDPLFIIFKKLHDVNSQAVAKDNNIEPVEKYQFHYGSVQFMDSSDIPVFESDSGNKVFKEVHRILVNTVGERFPFLQSWGAETDIGVSKRDVTRNAYEDIERIEMVDLETALPYGGSEPAILTVDDINIGPSWDGGRGMKIVLEWRVLHHTKDSKVSFESLSGRDNGPATIVVVYNEVDKVTSLIRIVYYDSQTNPIAMWTDKKNLEIYDGLRWREIYKQQYEAEIKGKENEFAKLTLAKYLPDEVKNKNFSSGQLLQENHDFSFDLVWD